MLCFLSHINITQSAKHSCVPKWTRTGQEPGSRRKYRVSSAPDVTYYGMFKRIWVTAIECRRISTSLVFVIVSCSWYQIWWHLQAEKISFHFTLMLAELNHYSDAIMSAIASQITSLTMVYSTVYSGAEENIKAPGYRPLWRGFTGEFPAQRPVTRKMFLFDDVIMCSDISGDRVGHLEWNQQKRPPKTIQNER